MVDTPKISKDRLGGQQKWTSTWSSGRVMLSEAERRGLSGDLGVCLPKVLVGTLVPSMIALRSVRPSQGEVQGNIHRSTVVMSFRDNALSQSLAFCLRWDHFLLLHVYQLWQPTKPSQE